VAHDEIRIEAMSRDDLDDVLVIEASGHPRPWTRAIFEEELQRECARLEVLRRGQGPALAFCNYWLVHDELHLLNIVIHPDERRKGYGRQLMRHLLAVAEDQDCGFITLEVRVSNSAAIALYEAMGFAQVGIRPNYYAAEKEDAAIMVLDLRPGDAG
jgi:ribosomal-protein-alanine N-acetyltransferase